MNQLSTFVLNVSQKQCLAVSKRRPWSARSMKTTAVSVPMFSSSAPDNTRFFTSNMNELQRNKKDETLSKLETQGKTNKQTNKQINKDITKSSSYFTSRELENLWSFSRWSWRVLVNLLRLNHLPMPSTKIIWRKQGEKLRRSHWL